MRALVFIILALLALAAASYAAMSERRKKLGELDRRLSRNVAGAPAILVRERSVFIPEMVVPLFARAQIEPSARAVGLGSAGVLLFSLLGLLISPMVSLFILLGLPCAFFVYVGARARRRIDALIEALPHYIDAVRQMQMVGNSLPQALERALLEAPDKVRAFMAPVARRLELGAPVADTMQLLSQRLRVPEVAMLAAAISTNLRYGGSITTVLANLSGILRSRIRIRREMEAATSQAKVSSRILIVMPIAAMVLLMAANPDYLDFFVRDPRGHRLAIIAVVLQGMGMLVMNRMLRLAF